MLQMRQVPDQRLTTALSHFMRAEAASTLTTFALMMPVLAGAVGISIDYGRAALVKTRLQAVADSAALMSARQLQLAQVDGRQGDRLREQLRREPVDRA